MNLIAALLFLLTNQSAIEKIHWHENQITIHYNTDLDAIQLRETCIENTRKNSRLPVFNIEISSNTYCICSFHSCQNIRQDKIVVRARTCRLCRLYLCNKNDKGYGILGHYEEK